MSLWLQAAPKHPCGRIIATASEPIAATLSPMACKRMTGWSPLDDSLEQCTPFPAPTSASLPNLDGTACCPNGAEQQSSPIKLIVSP